MRRMILLNVAFLLMSATLAVAQEPIESAETLESAETVAADTDTIASSPQEDPLVDVGAATAVEETSLTSSGNQSIALNPTTSIGLSIGSTLAATPAVMVQKYFTEQFGVHAGLGFDITKFSGGPDGATVDGSRFDVSLVGYGSYRLRSYEDFALNALGGLEVGYGTASVDTGAGSLDASGMDFRFAAGLQGELFIFDRVSLYAQVGMSLGILSDVSTATNLGVFPAVGSDTSSISFRLGPPELHNLFGLTWWL